MCIYIKYIKQAGVFFEEITQIYRNVILITDLNKGNVLFQCIYWAIIEAWVSMENETTVHIQIASKNVFVLNWEESLLLIQVYFEYSDEFSIAYMDYFSEVPTNFSEKPF